MSANRRPPSIIESFNYAAEGIIHVLRTQRNMRIHFAVAALVLIAALVSGVDKLELIALLLAIAFVLIAEMLNTAVEAAIDVATTSFDPMAKLAKDIAAGAVLIATAVAVAVGYLVFSGQVAERSSTLLNRLTDAPAQLTLIALVLTTILVVATKALTGRGSPLRGGLPSGHAAVAFAGWMAATLILEDSNHHFLISSLTFIMALLVAQTRVESGVHSSVEVAYGGLLGALVTLAVFQVAK
jgi:diacylglycerol kinase (ATP)